jgi:glycosyltransferase involved in cell wall biosynthesis
MRKILFVCGSMQVGGAEKQLLLLAKRLSKKYSVSLFLFGRSGPMSLEFENAGLEITTSSGSRITNLYHLTRQIVCNRPDVQINWLYEADVLGGLLGRLLKVPIIINSARNTYWPGYTKFRLKVLELITRFASSDVVANSRQAFDWHASQGYPRDKIIVIPNLLPHYSENQNQIPDLMNSKTIRLGIASRPVSGKGHKVLLDAIQLLPADVLSRIECSFIGFGLPESVLASELRSYPTKMEILEGQHDISNWLESIDVYCGISESWESDSNSINEAILNLRHVIASDLINKETYVPAVSIAERNNPKSVAIQLDLTIGQDPKIYKDMLIERRRNLISSRNPEVILSQWESLFGVRNHS